MTVGTYLGSWIPSLWGAGGFSMSSVFLAAVGGLTGIWLAFKISG